MDLLQDNFVKSPSLSNNTQLFTEIKNNFNVKYVYLILAGIAIVFVALYFYYTYNVEKYKAIKRLKRIENENYTRR